MKSVKAKTKKLSESKCKGRKITDIGRENEEQNKKMRNSQYRAVITWSRVLVLTPPDRA